MNLRIDDMKNAIKHIRQNVNFAKKTYKDVSPAIRVAELEAHTFQFLTQKALECFYPEVLELHRRYIAQRGDFLSRPQEKKSMKVGL